MTKEKKQSEREEKKGGKAKQLIVAGTLARTMGGTETVVMRKTRGSVRNGTELRETLTGKSLKFAGAHDDSQL